MLEALRGLVPNTEVRPVTLADAAIITDLMQRVGIDAVGEPDTTEDEVRDDLVGARLNLETDTFLVVDQDGRAVAYGQAYDEHDERGFVDVFVEPSFDDPTYTLVAQHGVRASLARLASAVRERSGSSTTASAGAYRQETRLKDVYSDSGFTYSTTYWRMSVDLTDTPVSVPELPSGLEIRAVDPDDDDIMRSALEVRNESFARHHGHVDMTFDEFVPLWRGLAKYDRNAWWIAYAEGVPVGINLCDESKVDEASGYVRALGVLPEFRGRGIAKALLLTSFAEYSRRGRRSVQLGVDTANDTGATRLYEQVGMKPIRVFDTYEQTVVAS